MRLVDCLERAAAALEQRGLRGAGCVEDDRCGGRRVLEGHAHVDLDRGRAEAEGVDADEGGLGLARQRRRPLTLDQHAA